MWEKIDYNELDSTQLEAKRLSSKFDRVIISTKKQCAGIGTHDRKWYNGNEKNNIAITFMCHPNCNIGKLKNITIDIAYGLVYILKEYNIKADIKEPNDIILNGKKLAGILVETNIKGEIVEILYVGIGLNVNQTDFPESLIDIATSMNIEMKKNYNVENIEDKLVCKIIDIINDSC